MTRISHAVVVADLWTTDRCCGRRMMQLHRGMMGKESSKRTAAERAPPALYTATDELSREKRSIPVPSLSCFFLCFFNLGLNFGLGFCIDFITKVLQRQLSRAGSTSQQLCHAQIHQEAEDGDENPQGGIGEPLQPTHGPQTPSQLQQPLCRHSGVQASMSLSFTYETPFTEMRGTSRFHHLCFSPALSERKRPRTALSCGAQVCKS